jgi:hypothetical protein
MSDVDYTVFDYGIETADSLRAKIANEYEVVSIVQHNYARPTYQFIASMPEAVLSNVETVDPNVSSWAWFISLMAWLKSERNVQTVDLLACDLWASEDWRYAISKISALSGVHIRASVNITGFGGDFILESDNVNLVGEYFTSNILLYRYAFYYASNAHGGMSTMNHVPVKLDGSGGTLLNQNGRYADFLGKNVDISFNDIPNVIRVYSNYYYGSAALTSTGRVYTYGNPNNGGDSSDVSNNLLNSVVKIVEGRQGFAALRSDGVAVSWGSINNEPLNVTAGNIVSHRSVNLTNCVDIVSSQSAFAALKSNGSVVTWGCTATWPSATSYLYNVVKLLGGLGDIQPDFFALRSDGVVVSWGGSIVQTSASLNSSSPVVDIYSIDTKCLLIRQNRNIYEGFSNTSIYTIPEGITITQVHTTYNHRYMIRFSDGSAFTNLNNGSYQLLQGVGDFVSNDAAYAYIQNGAVYAGGDERFGGSLTSAAESIQNGSASSGVIRLGCTSRNMAALKSDGTVVSWGYRFYEPYYKFENIQSQLTNIVDLIDLNNGYIAIKSNGSMVSWGHVYTPDTNYSFPTVSTTSAIGMGQTLSVLPTYYSVALVEMPIEETYSPTQYSTVQLFTLTYQTNVQYKVARESRRYGLYFDGEQISTFMAPQGGTYTYTFTNCSINSTSNVDVTIVDITDVSYNIATLALNIDVTQSPPTDLATPVFLSVTPKCNALDIMFYQINNTGTGQATNCYYSVDTVNYYPMNITQGTYTITGLSSSDAYTVRLKTKTLWGLSEYVEYASAVTPYSPPPTPALNTVTPFLNGVSLDLTQASATNGTIIGYQYSINGGITFQNMISTPLVVSGLNSLTTYTDLQLRSVSNLGASDPVTVPTFSTSINEAPGAPTIVSVSRGNGNITVIFTKGTETNITVSGYKYSLDGVNYEWATVRSTANANQFAFDINGLTNGTSYSVYLKAYTNTTSSNASNVSATVTPCGVPDAPVIVSHAPGNGVAYVTISAGNANGSAITKYQYSLAGSSYADIIETSNPYVIPGVTNGQSVAVTVRAVNDAGPSAESSPVTILTGIPSKPVISGVTAKPKAMDVFFNTNISNGFPITKVYYSLNGGADVMVSITGSLTSPITISGLTNGTSYSIRLKATNVNGTSGYSESSTSTIVCDVPNAVNLNATTSTTQYRKAIVYFTPPANNGGEIIKYQYAFDSSDNVNPPKYDLASLSSPAQIDISNNVVYVIRLYAVNSAGTSPIGNAVTLMSKYEIPSTPWISTVTATKNTRTVLIGKPSSIGSAIKTYWYSLKDIAGNQTSFVDLNTTGTVGAGVILTIPNVPNNANYAVSIKAENDAGFSLASAYSTSYTRFVYLPPSNITGTYGLNIKTGGLVDVTLTTPSANGGTISAYKYKFTNSSTVYTTTAFVNNNTIPRNPRTTLTISGLTPGSKYMMQFLAVNELNAADPALDPAWSTATILITAK